MFAATNAGSAFRVKIVLLILAALMLPGMQCSDSGTEPAEDALRVLFIGNSYTYYNDLPSMLAQFVSEVDERPILMYGDATIGGAALETHWNDGGALAMIQQGPWDYVVLQEGSGVHFAAPEIFLTYAQKFDEEIKKAGAETLLFQTWASSFDPGEQDIIDDAYLEVSQAIGADIVPVGSAWEKALFYEPDIGLHSFDGYHPGPKGTYLAACVFYAYIYDRNPSGLPYRYVSNGASITICTQAEAEFLQQIAWETVLGMR